MQETREDLQRLQGLMDDSLERASSFLRRSFGIPEHSLSADQLVSHLQGSLTIALGTVTASGEPRVAPINALFFLGEFCVPTVAESARARHLASRPSVSLTYFENDDLAVIVHGQAMIVGDDDPEFAKLDELQTGYGMQSPREWDGRAIYLRIQPTVIYTYAGEPDRYPATSTGPA